MGHHIIWAIVFCLEMRSLFCKIEMRAKQIALISQKNHSICSEIIACFKKWEQQI